MAASETFHNVHSNIYDRIAGNCTYSVANIVLADLPVPITLDSYILDSACGSGLVTAILKTKYPFARIHGVDVAPGMIAFYNSRIAEHNWENITSEVLDVRDLKAIKDETFTHVITNFRFAPDVDDLGGPLKAAKEMYRVLKPGGIAIVTTWAERNFTLALESAQRRIRPDQDPFSWRIPPEWDTGSWLMAQFEAMSFKHNVSVKPVPGRMDAGSLDEMVENLMLGKDMFFKGYSEEELASLRDVLAEEIERLDVFRSTEGGVEIGMVAWVALVFVNFYLGIAQGSLEFARKYTTTATRAWPFGGDNKDSPTEEFYILERYGNFLAHLRAAETLTDKAGQAVADVFAKHGVKRDVSARQRGEIAEWVASAKVVATDTSLLVTAGVFEVTGSRATGKKVGLDRFWRDVRTHTLHDPVAYKNRELGEYFLLDMVPEPSWYT